MLLILERLAPLYLIAVLGYLAGKKLDVRKESIAPLLIYIFSPSVVFFAVLRAKLDPAFFALPVVSFGIASIVCLAGLYLSGFWFSGSIRNLMAFAGGDANSGYFGIPLALALFGEAMLAPYIMLVFGLMIYENSVGFYVTARGNFSHHEAFRRVLRLPTLYAFACAVLLNIAGVKLSEQWLEIGLTFRGAYSVLGMMLIGLGIASLQRWTFDVKMNIFVSVLKFCLWPLIALGAIWLDMNTVEIFTSDTRRLLFFMSTLPLAANTVPFATLLNVEPEKASVAVLFSTLLGTILIPLLNSLMMNF